MRYDCRVLFEIVHSHGWRVEVGGTDFTDQKVFAFDIERSIVWFYGPSPQVRPDRKGLIVGSSHGYPVRVFDKDTGADFVPPSMWRYRREQFRQWLRYAILRLRHYHQSRNTLTHPQPLAIRA